MANKSTPIEHLINMDDDGQGDDANLSASQQVLRKYNELENQTEERAQINTGMDQHQMDPALANQHRMMELERARQFQQQHQMQQQAPPQQAPPPQNKGFMSNLKGMAGDLPSKLSGPLIVIILFVLFNMGVVNKTLTRFIPKIANEYGTINMKGIVLKAVIVGILFFIVRMFI